MCAKKKLLFKVVQKKQKYFFKCKHTFFFLDFFAQNSVVYLVFLLGLTIFDLQITFYYYQFFFNGDYRLGVGRLTPRNRTVQN